MSRGDNMKSKLINDIDNYISYLNEQGLYVSVHGKMISGLLKHNIHKNPYCSFVKTKDEAWQQCIKCQQKVFNRCNNNDFFGMCWAGVEEYVFYVDAKTFVSVSGYGIDRKKATERFDRLSQRFNFNESEILTAYNKGLKHKKDSYDELKILIKPLCHMLSLLQLSIGDISQTESKSKTFDSILAFIEGHFMQDITLCSIAEACSCSESTVSHLFKAYSKQSVKKYINDLRIKQAEKFLISTDLPTSNIADFCGFTNSNYFSTTFKKQFGLSPQKYRLKKQGDLD